MYNHCLLGNIDTTLAVMTSLLAYLIILPIIYLFSQTLVPKFVAMDSKLTEKKFIPQKYKHGAFLFIKTIGNTLSFDFYYIAIWNYIGLYFNNNLLLTVNDTIILINNEIINLNSNNNVITNEYELKLHKLISEGNKEVNVLCPNIWNDESYDRSKFNERWVKYIRGMYVLSMNIMNIVYCMHLIYVYLFNYVFFHLFIQ